MFGGRLQTQFTNLCLTLGTFSPTHLRTLVSTDMNIFGRENIHDFIQNIFGKLKGLLITTTQHFIEYTKTSRYLVRSACTSQLWIRCQCGHHVTRHVNLRYDGDETLSSITHNFLGLFLCIESADRYSVVFIGSGRSNGFLPIGADFRQFGIFLNFDTPSLVLRQMPMEIIDIVQSKNVDNLFQIINGKIMTTYIHHKSTISETGIILDGTSRQRDKCPSVGNGQGLVQRLYAVKHTDLRCAFQYDAVLCDLHFIAFLIGYAFIQNQLDLILAR